MMKMATVVYYGNRSRLDSHQRGDFRVIRNQLNEQLQLPSVNQHAVIIARERERRYNSDTIKENSFRTEKLRDE